MPWNYCKNYQRNCGSLTEKGAIKMKLETDKLMTGKTNDKGIYRKPGERFIAVQHFDTENIHVIRGGKKINVQEWIDANNVDVELVPTLEKYGVLDKPMVEKVELVKKIGLLKKEAGRYGNENQNLNFIDGQNIVKRGKEIWNSLNPKTREYFHNDVEEFINNAEKVYKKFKAEIDAAKQQPLPLEPKENGANDVKTN